MRVAQFIETLGAGGAERLAVDIASSLAERGHSSHLIVMTGSLPAGPALPAAVQFHPLGLERGETWTPAGLYSLARSLGRLRRILGRHRIEILQTHLPLANFCGLIFARNRGCLVFPTIHNNREFDYGETRGPLRGRLRRRAYRMMLQRCAGMIAVSERVKRAMVAELGLTGTESDRIRVVPNGVRIPAPLDPAARDRVRAQWHIPQGEALLLGVGRLAPQKNFGDLLDALAGLPAACPPWRCLIAGEGPQRRELDDKAADLGLADRVQMPGHVPDVGDLRGAADIFCFPSLWEGMPLALLEAMAAGLPVVAYAIDGVADLAQEGREGFLCAPGRTEDFAGAVARLLAEPALRSVMGAASRETAGRHGWEPMMDLLESIYRG